MKKNTKKKSSEVKFVSKELKKVSNASDDYKKFVNLIIVLVVMAVLFGGLFYFNGKFVSKDEFQGKTTTTTTEVSFDASLLTVDNMFKVSDKDYYVMVYESSDKLNGAFYGSLVTSYKGNEKLYSIDLQSAMNKKYYNKDGKENTNPTKASDVSFTRPALIHIKNGKVVSFETNKTKIIEKLNEKSAS